MKLTNILPDSAVTSIFLGRDEALDEVLEENFASQKVVRMIQTHSDRVVFLDQRATGQLFTGINFLDNLDGVFTDQRGVVLVVKVADCYPILLSHPAGVIGVVHAGRVGTGQKILQKSLELAIEQTGLSEGWQIWLGPKICRDCYQINRETNEHYDLQAKNVEQLQAVLDGEKNFALDSGLCTHHQNDWFYSYRKEGPSVPMNYGLIALGHK